MLHQFDPFLVRFSGDFGIQWYGFSYLMGFVLAFLFLTWLVQRQRAGMLGNQVLDFLTYGMIGVLLGGRLGYCLFYDPELFIKFRPDFPFWGVLAINEGGMASHGGMIGFVIACLLYAHQTGISQLYLFDLGAIAAPMGLGLGRVANFMNGELVGRVMETPTAWSVKFPHDILSWPTTSLDRLTTLGPVVEKVGVPREEWLQLLETYRTDPTAQEKVNVVLTKIISAVQTRTGDVAGVLEPLLDFRHPYQLYAAASEGFLLFVILLFMWRKPRQPGVIGSLFLVFYAILRIVGEQFREPDLLIGYQWLGLTRGQWFSCGMLVFGLAFLILWGRREGLPIAGWWKAPSVRIHRRS